MFEQFLYALYPSWTEQKHTVGTNLMSVLKYKSKHIFMNEVPTLHKAFKSIL